MPVDDRAEHLAWCKQRALEYVQRGDLTQAFTSLVSDLGKHPKTRDSADIAVELGGRLLLAGHLSTARQMEE